MTSPVGAAPAQSRSESPHPPAPAARSSTVLLVTGLSGAGRTSALKILEDMGYEAVDNVPMSMLGRLARGEGEPRPTAIGIDSRTRGFTPAAVLLRLERLKTEDRLDARLIFLACDDEVLRRRFTATRRRHPLALDRPIGDGIRQERAMLSPLRERADLVVDTSELSLGELKQLLHGHYALERSAPSTVAVLSFSYRNGLPREADLVFDARFLDNPHYVEALRPLSGRDEAVARFLEADPAFLPFFERLSGFLLTLMPRFEREGKSYLTVAIGCTGGRHRSVYVAERLAEWLGRQGCQATLRHRDLGRAEAT